MCDLYFNNNLINVKNMQGCNFSGYVPYADFNPMSYYQNYFPSSIPCQYIINSYNNQNQTFQKTEINKNTIQKETDSDLIQLLSGNYLEENKEETLSDEKTDKKEIEISLGKIVVENSLFTDFPIIKLKNNNKYNISISENILNKGEYFTAIKEEKENKNNDEDADLNEVEMVDINKNKTLIPDNYIIDINDKIKNNIIELMNPKEINILKGNKLLLTKTIGIIYDKCIYNISEIKRFVKNRVKKIKSINLSVQLKNLINLHNELLSIYLSLQKTNINNMDNSNENNKSYITYAQFYIENNNGKTFKCEICGKIFINFQTLGGHMSKVHPNRSEKYKKQNDIRKQREGQRKLLDLVKEKLFEKYNLNYRLMKKNDEKEKIKSFIKAHQKEYEVLRRKIYRENALKNSE